VSDVALAVAVAVVQVLGTHFAATTHHQANRRPLDLLAYVLLVAGPVALVVRRR
jgi:hypothetical protein